MSVVNSIIYGAWCTYLFPCSLSVLAVLSNPNITESFPSAFALLVPTIFLSTHRQDVGILVSSEWIS